MKPGRRDDLIACSTNTFVEGQEKYGIKVIGQFRDLKDPRAVSCGYEAFSDMEVRRRALEGFYGGPGTGDNF